jgi:antitoxin MazE
MLVSQGRIVIQKPFRHKTLEERTAEYGGTLGPYREFEWGAPEGRERW